MWAIFTPICFLPPAQFDHVPREPVAIVFESPANTQWDCGGRGVSDALGCEWRDEEGWHAILAAGSRGEEDCRLRHADGHISEWEATGDANAAHTGWHYGR